MAAAARNAAGADVAKTWHTNVPTQRQRNKALC